MLQIIDLCKEILVIDSVDEWIDRWMACCVDGWTSTGKQTEKKRNPKLNKILSGN